MKAKDLLLVALICANVTLAAVGGALLVARSEPAAIAASEDRAGDYILITGSVSSSREALLVIDTVAQRANLYVPKAAGGVGGTQWELTDTRSLAADFGIR